MKNLLLSTAVVTLLAACGGSGASTNITADDANVNLNNQAKGLVTINTAHGKLRGYNQYASFYGMWTDNSGQLRELRYRGDAATDIPQSGTATYYGNAVRYDTVSNKELTDGKSRINVDFGKHTVDGEIKFDGLRRDITLKEGVLNGASYSGSASVIGRTGHGHYEGQLYGENAKETAGQVAFSEDSSLNTAFGGVRY
ncbi:MAG: Slam-dependent surface lipoprotein [Cardiobacteriaceae bacterium]|nr:Slam-dependent surface lipoprotein [Cardiobacteriaceae bacterium]